MLLLLFVVFEPLNVLINGSEYYLLVQALLPALIRLLMAIIKRNKLASLVNQIRKESLSELISYLIYQIFQLEDDDEEDYLKKEIAALLIRLYAIQFPAAACACCVVPVHCSAEKTNQTKTKLN